MHLLQSVAGERRNRVHRQPVLAGGFAQPQVHDRRLFFRFEAGEQDHRRRLQIGVAGRDQLARDPSRQELRLLAGVRAGAEVDVVGAQHDSGELGVGVSVFDGQPATRQHTGTAGCCGEPLDGRGHRMRPRRGHQRAVGAADQGSGDPVTPRGVVEGPPALVAVPLFVDLGLVAGQPPQHLASAVVGALRASRRAVLTHARAGDEVERTGPEAVGSAGQGPDRADLHGVAGEVRLERFVGVDADLLQRAALQHLDERVAGDLVGEPGTARAQDAALAVQQHLRGDVDRLGERALDVVKPRIRAAVGHRLVLQRALTALVAHRTIQRMVDQQQFHHAVLRLVGGLRAELRADHHVVGDGNRARRHRLTLAFDLHQALAARADRVQQRVVAEPGDLHADQLGGADHQSSLGNADFGAVDGQRHQLGLGDLLSGVRGLGHAWHSVRREHGQLGVERTAAALDMRDVFVAEELDRRRDRARRAIAQGAERLTENRIGDVQQLVQVFGSAVTGFQAVVDLTQPERALAAWRALAARLVLVEVDPPADRAHHAGGLVENLQRLGAQHRPG